MNRWHAWLELARISNLPTVWTNVLAGWLLAGGAWKWETLTWLLAGGSLLYTAGMILNDAFDAKFDREHRKERPIPSGRVPVSRAWSVGIGMMMAGAAISFFGAGACGWLVGALVVAIVAYDAFHKPWAGSVLIMGACRVLLYLVAGSAVTGGLDVHQHLVLIVKAVALGGYVVGLSLVARSEGGGQGDGLAGWWLGLIALLLPLIAGLAVWMFTLWLGAPPTAYSNLPWISIGNFRLGSWYDFGAPWAQLSLIILLGILLIRALQRMRTPPKSNIGRAVGLLLAGIVVVDAIAICPMAPFTSVAFAAAMPVLLMWQRKIAAT